MMETLNINNINPVISKQIEPFLYKVLGTDKSKVHSIYLSGSVITEDFNEKTSNINTVIILNEMSLDFVYIIASLGNDVKNKQIAAPLIMTQEYIKRSLDVFPIEFLDLKLIHTILYGDDVFKDININKTYLRIQLEREIKINLLTLWQGYITCLGQRNAVCDLIYNIMKNCMPLYRAIIFLSEKEVPIKKQDVVTIIEDIARIETDIFIKINTFKEKKLKITDKDIKELFEQFYKHLGVISDIVDTIKV